MSRPGLGADPATLPAPWRQALDGWDDYAVRAGYGATTRKRRRRYLARIVEAGELRDPWTATTATLGAALTAAAMGLVCTRDARGALRNFYGWALAAGHVSSDPAHALTGAAPPPFVEPARAAARGRAPMPRRAPTPVMNDAWTAAVDRWTTYNVASGTAVTTVQLRRRYLAHFSVICPDPWAATLEQLLEFVGVDAWAPETRKTVRGALRSFYGWATLAGHFTRSPADALPAVRVPQATPKPAPADVVEAARARATPDERLMLDLALMQGMRRAEIARAHSRDVEGGNLRVHGKGGKERLVPLHPDVAAQLERRPPGYLFPTHTGQPVTAYTVGDTLSTLLGPGWTGHCLRHAAGTRWYRATGDVLAVSRLLGHSKPETSTVYISVPDDMLRDAVLSGGGR